ncbi:MAG: nucleotidyltransferase domain-containing protein [Anaerolineae bacterium]|nr:nucleotidyltransferase domain-containing protein [Anaerolineae bacterium]
MIKTRGLEQPEDLEALKRVFGKYPEVRAVYLFGSIAEGRKGPESDLDLAIVPRSPAARARRLDILADLARAGFCNVDLIFLDTSDIVLRYEAVRLNRVVYQAEDFDPGEMYSRIVRQYLDFLPYLQVQREAYRRRILHDSGRGHPQAVEQTG